MAMSAEIFERDLVPAIFRPWAAELVDLAAPHSGERILDLACGTGIVIRTVLDRVAHGRFVGLEFDPAMLAVAATVCPEINWLEGNALALPFADQSFDLVVCQQGLQYLPDHRQGLAEAYRVTREGGRLVLGIWTALSNTPGHAAVFVELGKRLGPDAGRPTGWSLTDAGEIESLLQAAGYTDVRHTTRRIVSPFPSARSFVESLLMGASKITRAALARLPEDERGAFVRGAAARLAEYEDDDGVHLQMESRLITARRPGD